MSAASPCSTRSCRTFAIRFRTLRRDAGFTTFAILIVGLGIGASSTVFSVVNALLLRPLPFPDPERLVWMANDGKERDLSDQTTQVNPFLDLREQPVLLRPRRLLRLLRRRRPELIGGGEPERLSGVPVSQNFFPVLGVQPQFGRLFTAEECTENGPAVLLSDAFWNGASAPIPPSSGGRLR